MLTLQDLLFAIATGIFSIVYAWILTDTGMILQRPYEWLKERLENKYDWLWFPLMGCPKCVAGQLALWLYIYFHWTDYNLINHVYTVGAAIFFSWLGMDLYLSRNK